MQVVLRVSQQSEDHPIHLHSDRQTQLLDKNTLRASLLPNKGRTYTPTHTNTTSAVHPPSSTHTSGLYLPHSLHGVRGPALRGGESIFGEVAG